MLKIPNFRAFLTVYFIGLTLVLLACGSGEPNEPSPESSSSDSDVSQPASQPDTATAEEATPERTGASASTYGNLVATPNPAMGVTPSDSSGRRGSEPTAAPKPADTIAPAETTEATLAPEPTDTPAPAMSQCPESARGTASPPLAETSVETDRKVLETVFESTGGDETWGRVGGNWLGRRPIGEWEGVRTDREGRVISLKLGHGPTGEIPPELGNLSKLRELEIGDLLGNSLFHGEIPPELGNLVSLETLSIGAQGISGRIPPELGNLSNLKFLHISASVCGEIPAELGNLAKLQSISIIWSKLSGEIPPELGNLTGLWYLALIESELNGEIPPELGNLTGLTSLSLSNNRLSGKIPPELGNLYIVREMNLSGNKLTGEIPPEFDNLVNLRRDRGPKLEGNQLSGCVSDVFRDRFEDITMPVCEVAHEEPQDIDALVAIFYALGEPPWGGWLSRQPVSEWEGVSVDLNGRVAVLDIGDPRGKSRGSKMPPELGTALGNLDSMTALSISFGTYREGQIPSEIGNLSNLRSLSISGGELSEGIPPELGNLSNLRGLSIHGRVGGKIPPEIGNLSNLQVLDLHDGGFSGEIPPELGNLTNLRTLRLGENYFSGEIPPELGNPPYLRGIDVKGSRFSGCLPANLNGRFTKFGAPQGIPLCR